MINLLTEILLPPVSLAIAALLLLMTARRGRLGAAVALVLLIGLGLPIVATALLNSLTPAPSPAVVGLEPSAIVILSADSIRVQGAADLDPGPLTLDRMRSGAALARRTGLPILVSGGAVPGARTTLAAMMGTSLHDDFRLDARWEETRSRDTWENARFSAAILHEAGIQRIYLVTHDWHMRRSLLAFRHFGLDPVPISVRPAYNQPFLWRHIIISPVAWYNSFIALHEWIGLAYYSLRQ